MFLVNLCFTHKNIGNFIIVFFNLLTQLLVVIIQGGGAHLEYGCSFIQMSVGLDNGLLISMPLKYKVIDTSIKVLEL